MWSHNKIFSILNVTFRNLVDISDVSEESIAPLHISGFEGFSGRRQVSTKQHGVTPYRKVTAITTSNLTLKPVWWEEFCETTVVRLQSRGYSDETIEWSFCGEATVVTLNWWGYYGEVIVVRLLLWGYFLRPLWWGYCGETTVLRLLFWNYSCEAAVLRLLSWGYFWVYSGETSLGRLLW